MNSFIQITAVLFFIVSLLLLLVILVQKPKQEGLGLAFGGGAEQVFGAGAVDVLKKVTAFLAFVFFLLILILGALISKQHRFDSLLQDEEAPEAIRKEKKSSNLKEMWKKKKKQ